MYNVIWIYRKGSSTAPFFYEVPESADFTAAIETVYNQNPGLMTREIDPYGPVLLDKFTFAQPDDYKIWLDKFLEQLPNGLIERNKYIISNNQELFVKTIVDNDVTKIVRIIPVPEENE